jgi:hypothetical protein
MSVPEVERFGLGGDMEADPADAPTLAEHERADIVATLERVQWRVSGPDGAEAVLGISRGGTVATAAQTGAPRRLSPSLERARAVGHRETRRSRRCPAP